jgi:hypothetical protein
LYPSFTSLFFFHKIVSFLYFFCLFQNVPTTGILTTSTLTVEILFTLFGISILSFGSNNVMMGSYAEPQRELPPQLQQQLQQQQLQQQQGLTTNVTASPSPQLLPQQQQQLQQQQAPPITFQQGEEKEPCDGAYFIEPGGVTKCI